jgi:hypothetical protein
MTADLRSFQERLNSDAEFRSEFFKNPVKTLEAAGLVLPDAAKKRLTDLVNELRTKHQPVPGSSLGKDWWDIRTEIKRGP